MGIVIEGPSGLYEELGWDGYAELLAALLALKETSEIGVSVQKSSNAGGEMVAMIDQLAGKVGPMMGKWDPEKGNRMVQEF